MADDSCSGSNTAETLATRRCPFCAWVGIPADDAPETECPACGHGTVAYHVRRV